LFRVNEAPAPQKARPMPIM
jgi:hypothetical protein